MKQRMQWIVLATAAALAFPHGLTAQSQTPDLTGIAHIAFRVSDLDREVNFFGKMGFEEAFSNVENGRTLEVFIKVNDQQFIEVYPQAKEGQPLGFMHACYESADLETLHKKLIAEGLHPTPVRKAGAGNLISSLLDPDSRTVEITQYMQGSRHMNDRGQHLGDRRVSDTLLGFELPVTNLDASQKFYSQLGFDAEKDGPNYRLSIPANPDLRIELRPAHANDGPQFLFTVEDARRAADQLHRAGLKVERDKKLVFVRDPDGNSFVLLETGATHSPRRLVPWKR